MKQDFKSPKNKLAVSNSNKKKFNTNQLNKEKKTNDFVAQKAEKFKNNYDQNRDITSRFNQKNKNNFRERPSREKNHDHSPKEWQGNYEKNYTSKAFKSERYEKKFTAQAPKEEIRLNKYIANSGMCSRREADELIRTGVVSVNGKTIMEMGYLVKRTDHVVCNSKKLMPEKPIYILLNKPKGFITTTKDPFDREHVMQLIKLKGEQRVYPVGRLDRATTGLLLLTNDGEMTQKLTHPKFGVQKIYVVETNKNVTPEDLAKLNTGFMLEDGFTKADKAVYVQQNNNKKEIGIEIHSGKNRIIRRMFEHLGYEIEKLDRVTFAGLTKKDLPRGKFRILSEKEIGFLKMLPSPSKKEAEEKLIRKEKKTNYTKKEGAKKTIVKTSQVKTRENETRKKQEKTREIHQRIKKK